MGKWADPKNPTTVEAQASLGDWGQFDPARVGDAANFEWLGGTQKQYENMSPEEQAHYKRMLTVGTPEYLGGMGNWKSADNRAAKAWVAHAGGGSGAGAAGSTSPTPQGGPTAGGFNEYTQAAAPDLNNAWGGQQLTFDPTTHRYTQTNSLSPGLQGANDSLEGRYAQLLGAGPMTGDSARQQAIDSAYGQATSRLDPQWDKRMEAQRTQLLNQGLDPTSEAGRNAMSELGQQRNDAYGSAMNSAIAQGTAAGDSAFKNNQQALNMPLQQMAMIKALSQQSGNPQLLNALLSQKNNELGLAGINQANQADQTAAAMAAIGAGSNLVSGLIR